MIMNVSIMKKRCPDYGWEWLSWFGKEAQKETWILILKGVVREGTYSHHLMFCTDDKHPDEILEEGHIDFMVNRAD